MSNYPSGWTESEIDHFINNYGTMDYSFCCDAKIVNGICSECGEHADPDDLDGDDNGEDYTGEL